MSLKGVFTIGFKVLLILYDGEFVLCFDIRYKTLCSKDLALPGKARVLDFCSSERIYTILSKQMN